MDGNMIDVRGSLMLAAALALGALACSSDGGNGGGGSGPGGSGPGGSGSGGGGGGGGPAPVCTTPTEVPCSDEVVLQMDLKTDVAPGLIDSQPDGSGWISYVDATAGGFGAPNPDSYVYGRFTDTGLQKVELGDQDAIDSMDWDIAFRRYVIRINSGHSGPSCVTAAPAPGAVYDDLTVSPDGLSFRADEYFTSSCELIPDGTGLQNSPATALSGYWTYPGCVSMTGHVFVIELADGHRVKLLVTNYYDAATDVQQQCDETGSVPMPSGAAHFRLRWGLLQ